MRAFDWEAAKRGEKVCTSNGAEVVDLRFNEKDGIVRCEVKHVTIEYFPIYFDRGGYSVDPCGPIMLMMADDAPDGLRETENDHNGDATEKVDWTYWRHMFASMAMQIYIQNGTTCPPHEISPLAVKHADALIKELKK